MKTQRIKKKENKLFTIENEINQHIDRITKNRTQNKMKCIRKCMREVSHTDWDRTERNRTIDCYRFQWNKLMCGQEF